MTKETLFFSIGHCQRCGCEMYIPKMLLEKEEYCYPGSLDMKYQMQDE